MYCIICASKTRDLKKMLCCYNTNSNEKEKLVQSPQYVNSKPCEARVVLQKALLLNNLFSMGFLQILKTLLCSTKPFNKLGRQKMMTIAFIWPKIMFYLLQGKEFLSEGQEKKNEKHIQALNVNRAYRKYICNRHCTIEGSK